MLYFTISCILITQSTEINNFVCKCLHQWPLPKGIIIPIETYIVDQVCQ